MLMSEPLVSVVIPLFNKEDYIETTLNSVANQSYRNIELVIIDDSSTDSSVEKASFHLVQFKERFKNITIESRKNTGQAGARNDGIRLSKGEFVAFLDADDIWHPKKIELQVKFLANNPKTDLVFCNYIMVGADKSSLRAVKLVPVAKKIESWLLTTGFGGLLESTGFFRREALIQNGGFASNLQMCGGLDLAYRFSSKNLAGCVDEFLCAYRVTPTGWHNNKIDLVDSYHKLFQNEVLYGHFKDKATSNLRIHLGIWDLRNATNFKTLKSLAYIFIQSPIKFLQYVSLTANRLSLAKIRAMRLKQNSFSLLGWLKL